MKNNGTWHFNMPQKIKEVLDVLIVKADNKTCVEVQDAIKLREKINWTNLPTIVDDALELLAVNTERSDRSLPNWVNLPSRVALLEAKVAELDCRSLKPELEKEQEDLNTVEEEIEEVQPEQVEEVEEEEVEEIIEEVEEKKEEVSVITLVEYSADEDLSGDNELTSIKVYFEDKSGDETPNIGKKLFLDREMTEPLVNYKGAFYFTRPSQPEEKETIKVRGTGTVKKTKFEV